MSSWMSCVRFVIGCVAALGATCALAGCASDGEKGLDAIGATVVRAFMATVAKRGIQARGPVNLLRTLLTAAVETGALEAMPELPKPPPPGRKLPSAPSTEEVEAMLEKADGWGQP
jgi:hypothetical protein